MSKEEAAGVDNVELDGILDGGNEDVGNEVTLSPAEEKAMSAGWRPEEEWTGDPDEWVDAKTFNRNGEFMSRIQKQSKELNNNRSEIEKLMACMKELGEHNKKIAEQEYKKAIEALKQEKVAALEEDNHSAVVDIDDKIDELKESKKIADTAASEELHKGAEDVAPNPVFVEWAGTNKWYQDDVLLRGAADAIGMEYADNNPGMPIDEVLSYVTKRMTKEFPDKFGNQNQNKPGTVAEPNSPARRVKKNKYTEKDLTAEQREFATMFVNTGAFENVQEYVDSLVKSGDL